MSSLFYLQLSASETTIFSQPFILRSRHHHLYEADMALAHLLIRYGLKFRASLTVRSAICKPSINFTSRFTGI